MEEDLKIDFKKIKSAFSKLKPKKQEAKSTEDELEVEPKKIINFTKKHKTILLLLIPIFLAIFFRAYIYDMPLTDEWATSSVESSIRAQIEAQINQDAPTLNQESKNELIEQQYQEFAEQNQEQIDQQIQATADYYKNNYKDDQGNIYLPDIDTYKFYMEVKNILGDDEKAFEINEQYDSVYSWEATSLHPYLIAYSYKIADIFTNASIISIMFLIPVIFAALSIIPVFFITRRIAGNIGALFASIMLAINASYISRSSAGVADTDLYNIFFPLMIVWPLLESFVTKNKKTKIILASVAGLITGIYSYTWSGWWYIFDFILGALGIYFLSLILKQRKNIKHFFKNKKTKDFLLSIIPYVISTLIFVSLFSGFSTFIYAPLTPIGFTSIQEASKENYWPNVYTTVAELNPASLDTIISSLGGNLFFALSILGILLTLYIWRKTPIGLIYALLLIIWYIGIFYAATKGIRFIMMTAPAFAIGFGATIGIVYYKVSNWTSKNLDLNKKLIRTIFIILFILLLINPIKAADSTAKAQFPLYDDVWDASLTKIKQDTPEDAIISSWWDYGWWFMAIAERQVTFSGGSQNTAQAHWIGKVLSTSDEEQAVGLLRMLNCGKNTAYYLLENQTGSTIAATDLIYEIVPLTKDEARIVLEQNNIEDIDEILAESHCDNPATDIFITSEDMVSKAGVWAHFGGWDFTKSYIYTNINGKEKDYSVEFLQTNLGYTEEQAFDMYREVNSLTSEQDANNWISPFTGYQGIGYCSSNDEMVQCSNGLIVDKINDTIYLSAEQGYYSPEKYFDGEQVRTIEGGTEGLAVAYNEKTQTSFITSPDLLESMFTKLFFFEGQGTEHFKLLLHEQGFNAFDIYAWEVEW